MESSMMSWRRGADEYQYSAINFALSSQSRWIVVCFFTRMHRGTTRSSNNNQGTNHLIDSLVSVIRPKWCEADCHAINRAAVTSWKQRPELFVASKRRSSSIKEKSQDSSSEHPHSTRPLSKSTKNQPAVIDDECKKMNHVLTSRSVEQRGISSRSISLIIKFKPMLSFLEIVVPV
jgi:hypothetical protein